MKSLRTFTTLITGMWLALASGQIYDVTPGEITICASSPISEGKVPTAQDYDQLIDCGFNAGIGSGTVQYFLDQFKLIGHRNFKYFVNSSEFLKRDVEFFKSYVKALGKDPHLAGWVFKDEPAFSDLNQLQVKYNEFRNADPDHVLFMNLVGVFETAYAGNLKSFPAYLNYIQEKFNPYFWSYDYYPIIVKNGKLQVIYDQFYPDLEDFHAISKKTDKPFWNFSESMQYSTKWYSRPAATEAYLRWEAFNSLAYGAQGICYWTYGMRSSHNNEKYISALVDMNGRKTKAWYAAQKVNSEIKKFNDVFYGCEVTDVRHTGSKIYTRTKRLSGRFGPFRMVRSGDSGVVVSLIKNKGSEYAVVVNRDVLASQKVSMDLNPNKSVSDLTDGGKEYNWRATMNFTLNPGDYRIFKIK